MEEDVLGGDFREKMRAIYGERRFDCEATCDNGASFETSFSRNTIDSVVGSEVSVFAGCSDRPKQFLDRNTKTDNDTSEKPSFGRNQLIDKTISVLAKTVSFGRNSLFWPKQSLLAEIISDSVVHWARSIWGLCGSF